MHPLLKTIPPSLRTMTQASTPKTEVKILMLHGYTQSGALFRAKTRALEKLLAKILLPSSLVPQLIYPTGPNQLLPQDIPGYEGEASQPDAWSWWRKDDGTGEYLHIEKGMGVIADTVRQAGGIDGVCGFSQGAAAAGIVTAALEPSRVVPEGEAAAWVRELREANGWRPVRFAVSYSGFWASPASLAFLGQPRIATPMLHYLGGLDTVVDENRSLDFVERCENATIVRHPGGHYVPVSKEWVMPVAGFIKQHLVNSAPSAGL